MLGYEQLATANICFGKTIKSERLTRLNKTRANTLILEKVYHTNKQKKCNLPTAVSSTTQQRDKKQEQGAQEISLPLTLGTCA